MTYAEWTIEEFLSGVASAQVAPSAGASAAMTGALAASLCEMVCIHTVDVETSERLVMARADLQEQRDRLLTLADEDGAAISAVQTAFETDTEDDHETAALRSATEVPLTIAETAVDVAQSAAIVASDGNQNARTDAVVGATLARAAVTAAARIVRTNLELLPDEDFERDAESRLETAERDAAAALTSATERDAQ